MSPIVALFLKTAALPAAVATVALFFAGGQAEPWRTRWQSLIWGVAFAAGAYLLVGRVSLPPHDVSESFIFLSLLLAGFVWVSPFQVGTRYLVRTVFVVAAGALLLIHLKATLMSGVNPRNLLAFFFLGLGVWSILERTMEEVTPLSLLLLPLIAASGVSIFLLFSGSASFANLVTIACALFGGGLVLSFLFPARVSTYALVPYLSVLVVAFMAAGHFYLDINPWKILGFALPYVVLWVRGWFGFIPKTPLVEAPILGLIGAAPVGYFLWQAYKASGPLY